MAARPELIRNLFLTDEIDGQGVYGVKVYDNGKWHRVVFDDQVRTGGEA